MGLGAVLHTLNPRLSDKDLIYIVNHAGDDVILADAPLVATLQRVLPSCPRVRAVVALCAREHMPAGVSAVGSAPLLCYEELLAAAAPALPGFQWADVHEDAGCGLCYTSGTTGNPKARASSRRRRRARCCTLSPARSSRPPLLPAFLPPHSLASSLLRMLAHLPRSQP
jgi:fatty-acyl-CoA synthase